jgi:signal transduction histidine kinase
VVHPEDKERVMEIAERKYLGKDEIVTDVQFRIIKKNGDVSWLEIISKIIPYKGGLAVLITTLDITENKEAEKLILKENKKLLELNKMRKDIITRVSHELKTPLTSIYGASQILLKHLKPQISGEVLSFIEIFHKGALRLKKLVENIVDASRIESEKFKLNLKKYNLSRIIKECVDEMSYLLKNRKLTLKIDLLDKLDFNVDKIRLQQVITNILSNAIKNTPLNGKIYIRLIDNHEYVDIHIKDTGIGITKKEKELLFEKFGKIERYGMDLGVDIEGSGLGLYISKEIVELHGGQILVESKGRNKGALFIIRLIRYETLN